MIEEKEVNALKRGRLPNRSRSQKKTATVGEISDPESVLNDSISLSRSQHESVAKTTTVDDPLLQDPQDTDDEPLDSSATPDSSLFEDTGDRDVQLDREGDDGEDEIKQERSREPRRSNTNGKNRSSRDNRNSKGSSNGRVTSVEGGNCYSKECSKESCEGCCFCRKVLCTLKRWFSKFLGFLGFTSKNKKSCQKNCQKNTSTRNDQGNDSKNDTRSYNRSHRSGHSNNNRYRRNNHRSSGRSE